MGTSAKVRFVWLAFGASVVASIAGCGRGAVRREAVEAPTAPTRVVVIEPGTYFPDWPSLAIAGEQEYDETRSIEAREALPPTGPEAQVPMRLSGAERR